MIEIDDRNDRKIGFQKITLLYVHQKRHKDYSCEVAFILPPLEEQGTTQNVIIALFSLYKLGSMNDPYLIILSNNNLHNQFSQTC